jgi:hypothetical protein
MTNKTIHEYFALSEDEYKITIVSYMDIFSEKYYDNVKLALEKYDLRDFNLVRKENFQQNPVQFPSLSFGTLYFVEAVIGQMPRGMYEQIKQEISQATYIKLSALYVSEDGGVPVTTTGAKADDEALLSTAMGEHPNDKAGQDDGAQDLVGQNSVHSIMKAMDDRRKEKDASKRKIKEGKLYKTTHSVLKEHTGTSFRKGIYEFRIVKGEVVVEGRKDNSVAKSVRNTTELNEAIANHVPTFEEKYKL